MAEPGKVLPKCFSLASAIPPGAQVHLWSFCYLLEEVASFSETRAEAPEGNKESFLRGLGYSWDSIVQWPPSMGRSSGSNIVSL